MRCKSMNRLTRERLNHIEERLRQKFKNESKQA